MNGAIRELRRPRSYAVAAVVGIGAAVAGLPWFVAIAIAVVALLAGATIAIWSRPKAAAIAPARPRKPAAADRPCRRPARSRSTATFRLEGEYWTIAYRDATFRLHDAKGLGYIHRLLAVPGQELHVLDLVVDGRPAPAAAQRPAAGDEVTFGAAAPEPILDPQARDAYRRRIEDPAGRDRRRPSGTVTTSGRPAHAAELDFITDELNRYIRGDGTSRSAPDATERARVNVTRAIRASIAKIAEQQTSLGHHLDHDIRTGTYCSYAPDPAATPAWRL